MVDLVERPLQIHCDKVIELYCNSDKNLAKSKHIDIKFIVINDKAQNHIVSLDSVRTILNITDPLIKGLSPKSLLRAYCSYGDD